MKDRKMAQYFVKKVKNESRNLLLNVVYNFLFVSLMFVLLCHVVLLCK